MGMEKKGIRFVITGKDCSFHGKEIQGFNFTIGLVFIPTG